jgi:tripartite-type tricarboxylate transporter receptor subunit TctC
METFMNRLIATLAAGLALMLASPSQAQTPQAQNWPQRTVRFIVPLGPGAGVDIAARLLADKLTTRWGQPVVVENRPGASERIGAEYVAKAAPDGYTILATPPGPLVIAPHLFRKLPFDATAFVPISVLTRGHLVLVARPTIAVGTAQELDALANVGPGKLTYGSPGVGTPPHLTERCSGLRPSPLTKMASSRSRARPTWNTASS